MVRVPGDPCLVEHQQQVCRDGCRYPCDVRRQLAEGRVGQCAVGIGKQFRAHDAQHPCRGVQLRLANHREVAGGVQRRCFIMREAEHGCLGAVLPKTGQRRAQTKGFVVRMGTHSQHARPAWLHQRMASVRRHANGIVLGPCRVPPDGIAQGRE
jgi:hypothetical protein